MTGLAISPDVRSAFACYPGRAHSTDRSGRKRRRVIRLADLQTLRLFPDKIMPVLLEAWWLRWKDPFRGVASVAERPNEGRFTQQTVAAQA